MILQHQPNEWSCQATAWAMALGVDINELFRCIGHDGSEIIFPDLPDPVRRRGIHTSELVAFAIENGIACTPIDQSPFVANPADSTSPFRLPLPTTFALSVRNARGVIYCKGQRAPHAVAFTQGTILDPKGYVYPYDACQDNGLTPQFLWRLDAIAR